MKPVYGVHKYENDQVGETIPSLHITAETVNSAREKLQAFEEEMDDFQLRCEAIEEKSNSQFDKFMKEKGKGQLSKASTQSNGELEEMVKVPKETLMQLMSFVHNLETQDF